MIERTVFQNLNSGVVNDVVNANNKKIAERYNSIRVLIKGNPFITAVQLSERLSISHRTVQRALAKMQEQKQLIREGDKNGGRWIIVE